jgi:hypothetical protein
VRAGKLDYGFDAFTAGAAEKHLGQAATATLAELRREFAGEFGHVTLQHRRTAAVELGFEGSDNVGMVMAGIVDAVTGEEIDDLPPIIGLQVGTGATSVTRIHL